MKNGKWLRFGMGLCLLISLLFLPGTSTGRCCKSKTGFGTLTITNNTLFALVLNCPGNANFPKNWHMPASYTNRISLPAGTYRIVALACPQDPEHINDPSAYRPFSTYYPVVPDDESNVDLIINNLDDLVFPDTE
jgi:hypothetical protein